VGSIVPNIIVGFSDGTFGTLAEAFPCSAVNTHNVTSATTPDEVALKFRVPTARSVIGGHIPIATNAAGRDFDMVLYEGTTALKTLSFDSETLNTTPAVHRQFFFASETDMVTGVDYYFAMKPTQTGNVTTYSFDVANANHFQAHAGGTDWCWADRVDAGAWSPTTTRRPFAGIITSRLHDGAGGGGQRVIGG
jgi:hypothetical protein